MSWIAIVLGVFLFYQFVERRHKIVLLKLAGLLISVGAVLIGGYFGHKSYQDSMRGQGISVELVGKELKLERSKTKIIVEDVFGGMSENISRYYPDLSGADREALKQYLFAFYLTDPKVWEDITWAMSEDEFKALTAWQENKNSVTAASLKKFEEARQVEFFTKLPEMRSKAVTLPQKWRLYEDLKWARDSFFLDELKVSFHEKMLPEERLGMDAVSQLKASADSEFGSALNARSDLKTVLSFRVCNKRLQPLLSYSFYVSGFMKNRSTAQAVRATDRDALQTEFTGDIIVGPNACSGFEWTGPYKFFDRYKITDVQGNWQ